ncbi:hypothetical protein [Blastococcus brunescens]|uniref:Uncharacterized protein n=1 Tax=Blastococcus brunescens TaxID=1564165 RepID=A0ABZ1B3L7_9ACTN|nr:hypothetical protein [Blastococcus sp. BMG 8361]WRL65400.1 hypothetical protein U6N30_07135 [Blastococcus sp. BMG 8361]
MSQQSAADAEIDTRRPFLDGKRKGRMIAGAIGLLVGAWFAWYTWANVPMGTGDRPGAGCSRWSSASVWSSRRC